MEDKVLTIFATVCITVGITFLGLALAATASSFPCTNPKCDNRVLYSANYCSHCGKLYRVDNTQ